MMIDATITNSFTNLLSAFVLIFCSIASFMQFLKKDTKKISIYVPLLFITLLFMKIIAAAAHMPSLEHLSTPLWQTLALSMIFLNYTASQSIEIPKMTQVVIMLISLTGCFFFLKDFSFIYFALPMVFTYGLCAYYSTGKLRWGFNMIVISNIAWIGMRQIVEIIIGKTLPVAYRYDNDIYHFLIIASIILVYKGFRNLDRTTN